MSGIQSFKDIIARHRHLMTPDQALKADEVVLDANVHVPSTNATEDQVVGQKYLGDPDWYAKNEGVDPTVKPLYPVKETTTQVSNPIESNEPPTARPEQPNISGEGKL